MMDPNANTLGIYTEKIRQITCPHCNAELDVGEFDVFEDMDCPACGKEIKVPGRLGNFILLEELGRGAMGCVYLAQDETLNRLVALKVMRREYGDDPKMLDTLQREAQAMATLNHRNVVQVYSFGREDRQPYFVMELLEGERLDAMMADGGIVPETRILEIALDVTRGLEAARKAGLTHGDIKPANILMDMEGVAKVVDFGLARFMEGDSEIEVWGTPYYIAPEKARKKGEDSRSDQYSLGGTMFHGLAGRPPFDGETPTKVVIASLKEETPDVRDFNPEVTPKTAAVIRRMMDKNASRRYPTFASLQADLEEALAGARAVEEEKRRAAAEAKARGKKKKKLTLVTLMSVVGAVLLLAAGGVVAWQIRGQTPVEVIYDGPERALHTPLIRVEERNMQAAVEALAAGNVERARERLEVSRRHIPEEHASAGWHRFFTAGMLLYAQQPEQARERLRQAADQDPILFDGGRVPPEDPRLLARIALGEARERDRRRALRNAAPYFAHVVELADGYRHMLEDRPNDAARYFRAYGEFTPPIGTTWPYVLQKITPSLHLPRSPLFLEAAAAEEEPDPEEAGGPAATRPVFRLAEIRERDRRITDRMRAPEWVEREFGAFASIPSDEAMMNAAGMQLRPGNRFLASGVFRINDEIGEVDSAVVLYLGEATPAVPGQARGVLLHLVEGVLTLQVGDGDALLLEASWPDAGIEPGRVYVIGLGWGGDDPGSTTRELVVHVDGNVLDRRSLSDEQLPPEVDNAVGTFGRAPQGEAGEVHFGAEGVVPLYTFVIDRVVDAEVLFSRLEGQIPTQ